VIYTESAQNLGVSLDRSTNKESALEATQQQLPFSHHVEQSPAHPEPASTRTAEHTTEIPIAISRARYEVPTHNDAEHNVSDTLNRATSNGNGHEVILDDDREAKRDRNKLSPDSLASQQQRPFDHGAEQTPTQPDPAPTKATELEIEAPEIDLGGLIL
jgi:hypothetical protein